MGYPILVGICVYGCFSSMYLIVCVCRLDRVSCCFFVCECCFFVVSFVNFSLQCLRSCDACPSLGMLVYAFYGLYTVYAHTSLLICTVLGIRKTPTRHRCLSELLIRHGISPSCLGTVVRDYPTSPPYAKKTPVATCWLHRNKQMHHLLQLTTSTTCGNTPTNTHATPPPRTNLSQRNK